ncbi:MAG: transposase, partial [Anaerolineae bacterium]
HFLHVQMDVFIIMPNHVHGIRVIPSNPTVVRAQRAVPLRGPHVEQLGKPMACSIPTTIRSFKSTTTKHINPMRDMPGVPIWQRNYYEHIIRNETNLFHTRQYIRTT